MHAAAPHFPVSVSLSAASARASEQVLEMLRLDDRRRTARMCQAQMGIGPDEWEAISSHKRQVAYDEGVAAFLVSRGVCLLQDARCLVVRLLHRW